MFSGASQFNGNISKWNVSNVRNMVAMFSRSKFNGNISNWDVSNVKNMKLMFNRACKFNSNISKWDVSNVTDMAFMFNRASLFNGDISKWDVSNVTDMAFMFNLASQFNSNISKWNVSKVKNMRGMFVKTKFNRDISKWDVSNVENMSLMFAGADFDRDISNWNVSNVTDMEYMFLKATNFSCNLSFWKPKEKVRTSRMFEGAKNFFSVTGIPKSLNHWNYYRVRDFPDEILCRVSPSGKKEYGYRADSYDMWKCKNCGTRFVCSSKPEPYSGIKPCNPSSTGKPKQHRWVLDNGDLSKDETFLVNYKANWTSITAQWNLRYEMKKSKQKFIKELNKLSRLLQQ